jgi:hypothetical protein
MKNWKNSQMNLCGRRMLYASCLSVLLGCTGAVAQVFTAPILNPISPVADTTKVLVTAPYCSTAAQPFAIYNITSGTPVLFSDLSGIVNSSVCQEIFIAISPGLGGFPAGVVYAAYQTGTNVQVASIPGTGGPPTVFVTIPGIPVPAADPVIGITFDQVGTFSNEMLVTTGTGQVFTISSTGTVDTHQITGEQCCGVELESPKVAPLGFGAYGGYLFATGESPSAVFAIQPGTYAATALAAGPALTPRPEAVAFTDTPACSVNVGPLGVPATLIDAVYGANKVNFYNPTAPLTGYVNSEFQDAIGPFFGEFTLNVLNSDGSLGTQVANVGAQEEHLATVVCAPPVIPSTGRMTGGGSFFTPDGTRVTHGLELHCTVPSHPNTLEINWGGGNNFHLDTLSTVTCFLDPAFSAGHPNAGFNTMIGSGTGTLNGDPATITFEFTDAGEPGVNDQASIIIHSGATTFTVPLTNLDNGNQQAHK